MTPVSATIEMDQILGFGQIAEIMVRTGCSFGFLAVPLLLLTGLDADVPIAWIHLNPADSVETDTFFKR